MNRDERREAVAEKLGPSLMVLLPDDDAVWAVEKVFQTIGNDDIARAWLVGQNPRINDQTPLMAIAKDQAWAAFAALDAYEAGDFA